MTVTKPKITVIMPSLNVGDYIEECISSVINQTLEEIEIICVDSGSTDKTLDILEKYSKKDKRIKLINSKKKSYGHQVNLGLKESNGEYISIVETDDFIAEDMLESLYKLSRNSTVDIVKGTFNYINDSDKNNPKIRIDDVKRNLPQNKEFKLEEHTLFIEGHPSIWAGIYRTQFLKSNNIQFKEEKGGAWVDNPFFYETALYAKGIVYVHKPYYFYRENNPDSSSNSLNEIVPMERVLDIFEILEPECKTEKIWLSFYNRLFRYIEIILEHNDDSDENLSKETCSYIYKVVKKVDSSLVPKLKFNFQKLYYKYNSPLFMMRFSDECSVSKQEIELMRKENSFLHSNLADFRKNYNDVNYKYSQLKKEANNDKSLKEQNQHLKNELRNLKRSNNSNKSFKISVVMPIFNGGKYLGDSVQSILNQTLDDIEIVFINDGSTDDTLEILQNYHKQYPFVTVLDQKNLGSGKARNYGIKEAQGEYIAFLDADDFFMDDDALEKMYEVAKKYDANMVTANIKHDVGEKNDFKPFGPFYYYRHVDKILPEQYGIPWSFYKNIFRKDFLIENEIIFPDLLRGQDPVFLAEVLTKVDEIYAVPVDLYAYVFNSDVAKSNNYRKLHDQILHYKMVCDYLSDPKFIRRKTEYYLKLFLFVGRLNNEDSIDAMDCVEDIFKEDSRFIHRMANFFYLKYKNNPEMISKFAQYDFISVIINVKNKDDLKITLNALNNQTIKNFEIVCLNNSSEDLSDIKNISVIKNLPLDEVLHLSYGGYVLFLESGDYLTKNALEALYENISLNGSQIVCCNSKNYLDINKTSDELVGVDVKEEFNDRDERWYTFNRDRIQKFIFKNPSLLQNKLFLKEFLLEIEDLDFYLNNNFWELKIKSLLTAEKISVTKKLLAFHKVSNIHKDSIILNKKFHDLSTLSKDIIERIDDLDEFLKKRGFYDEYVYEYTLFTIKMLIDYLDVSRFKDYVAYTPLSERKNVENSRYLDYSKYYGSNSKYIGLSYDYSEEFYDEIKRFFIGKNYSKEIITSLEENSNAKFYIEKYKKVLSLNSYEEYKTSSNSLIDKLHEENIKLKSEKNILTRVLENNSSNVTLKTEDVDLEELKKSMSEKNSLIKHLDEYNEKLKEDTFQQEKRIENLDKLNKELKESSSWKLTRFLRRN